MKLEIKINQKCLDNSMPSKMIELEGTALFYYPSQRGYKPIYTVFARQTSQDWNKNPFPNEMLEIPHKMLIGNSDELTFSCKNVNVNFWDTSCYEDLSEWFLRPDATHRCSIHYYAGKLLIGNRYRLECAGLEINPKE
jgi:hypothetical protein